MAEVICGESGVTSATDQMPILSLQSVSKEYRSDGQAVRALDAVSLEVSSGEFVALVGRSGCGKSTLLNLAGAMDFPTSGQVLLDGVATRLPWMKRAQPA